MRAQFLRASSILQASAKGLNKTSTIFVLKQLRINIISNKFTDEQL